MLSSYTWPCPWWQASILQETLGATWCCRTGFFHLHQPLLFLSNLKRVKGGFTRKRHLGETLQSESTPTRTMGQSFGGWIEPFDRISPHILVLFGRTKRGDTRGLGSIFRVGWFWEVSAGGLECPRIAAAAAHATAADPRPSSPELQIPPACRLQSQLALKKKSQSELQLFCTNVSARFYKCQDFLCNRSEIRPSPLYPPLHACMHEAVCQLYQTGHLAMTLEWRAAWTREWILHLSVSRAQLDPQRDALSTFAAVIRWNYYWLRNMCYGCTM